MGLMRGWREHVGTVVAVVVLITVGVTVAWAATNLVNNGTFDAPRDKDSDVPGWHAKITSYVTIPKYADPENKKGRMGVDHYECGNCRYNWGDVRPWAFLYCPQCGHMVSGVGERSGFYNKNHESISLVKGPRGNAVGMNMSEEVGSVQGLSVISDLIKADPQAGYEISGDAISSGKASLKVFVEGFVIDDSNEKAKEWVKTLPKQANPLGQKAPLVSVFRKVVHVHEPRQWTHFSEMFQPPQNSRQKPVDIYYVSLYCYGGEGTAAFDNIELRKLSPRELAEYLKKRGPRREERFGN